jgi:D-alanyl-D-alanine carboxypeptidase
MSRAEAEKDASRTSAKAGESEHQSGLCVDLLERGERYLSVSFEESDCFAWLCENAHKYGYILRYPKGKEDITKYDYEPWHYRFVGVDVARVIYEDKICLEEYLARY